MNAAATSWPAAGLRFHMGKMARKSPGALIFGEKMFFGGGAGMGDDTSVYSMLLFGQPREDFWADRSDILPCRMLLQKKTLKKHGVISSFYLFVQKQKNVEEMVCLTTSSQ